MNVLDSTGPASTRQPRRQPMPTSAKKPLGLIALALTSANLPVEVCSSRAGFYIGTYDEEGPCSRESVEYWTERSEALKALRSGKWTQRFAA